MKQKMYKAKKHWVVAGVTTASLFWAPTVLAQEAAPATAVVVDETTGGSDNVTPQSTTDTGTVAVSVDSASVETSREWSGESLVAENVNPAETSSIRSNSPQSALLKTDNSPTPVMTAPSAVVSHDVKPTSAPKRESLSAGEIASDLSKVDNSDIKIRSHVENIGWQTPSNATQLIGTVGQSKRLEALELSLGKDMASLGEIVYQSHIQNIGWQRPVKNGELSGTVGQGKRLEAVNVRLTQELATHFDLYYRVHVQDYGWLDWTKNGANAGTEGLSKRIEAIEMQLLAKGAHFTGTMSRSFIKRGAQSASISYQTFIEKKGWQALVSDGHLSGSTGQNQQIESLKLRLHSDYLGHLSYQTHIQNVGWIPAVGEGQASGQGSSNRQVEAVRISLVGEISQYYDVYYRVHSQNKGWLGWAKNGSDAGTEGLSLGVEGIEVTLVKKGGPAPGTTVKPFEKKAAVAKGTSVALMSSASQGNYAKVNKIIYLDAGHGGADPGATYAGITEKSLNLKMQSLVRSKLERLGYKVITTRDTDAYLDLLPRSKKANQSIADLFVSIHFNASTSGRANGIETYYYQYYPEYQPAINKTYHNNADRLKRSAVLASAIQTAAVSATGAKDNGVLRETFAVLRETTAPAVLLELGYMSNYAERNRITNSAYQEKLAQAIVSGILSYYKTYSI